MSQGYQIVTRAAKEPPPSSSRSVKPMVRSPMVNMIESASQVVDSVVHEIGVKTLELILALSAEQVARPRTSAKASRRSPALRFATGARSARRPESEGERPRLRHKTEAEVPIPADEALRKIQVLSPYMLYADYRTGEGSSLFPYDLRSRAPQFGATFHF